MVKSAFYDRSRMTGRYLIQFCKKLFTCLLTLAPSVNLSVDTFPVSGDGFFYVSHFLIFRFYSYLLSILMCLLINFTTSCCSLKNGSLAITHTRTFWFLYSRSIFTTVQEWQAGIYCRFVRNSFTFLLTLTPSVNLSVDTLAKAKRLTYFCSVALLLEKWFACFPCPGTAFISYSFLLIKKSFIVTP